jgi:hypothetical protein
MYYDRKASDRKLEVGQKVLILLPTHTSKLLASNGENPVLSFGTSLYANSKYGIYSSYALGFEFGYAFNIFFSTH